ncbi:MAG: arginase family protein [Bdellovibrionales bacterium]|nr:arginase family protein [Bdellovibrionales bacterium]
MATNHQSEEHQTGDSQKLGAAFHLYGVPSHIGTDSDTTQSSDSELGPASIRDTYAKLFGGYNIPQYFTDQGDVPIIPQGSVDELLDAVEKKVTETLQARKKVVMLGGSHTFTLGSLRAVKKEVGNFSLLYFDAHPDLMPEQRVYFGSTLHHAIEEKVLDPKRIGFVGIRQIEQEEQARIDKDHIKVISPSYLTKNGIETTLSELKGHLPPPYYMSIDLDGMDPALAPGVTTPFPFGLTSRELLALTTPFCGKDLLGFEIVEYSKSRDVSETTAILAAALLQELTAATAA